VVPIKLIAKAFGHPYLAYSYSSCDIMCAFPRISFHSCNYGISVARCPYSPWATCTTRLIETLIQRWKHLSPAKSASIMQQEFGCISGKRTLSPRPKGMLAVFVACLSNDHRIGSQYRCKNLKSRTVSHILATITRSPPYPTSARQTLQGLQAASDPHLSKQSREQRPLCDVCLE
jgi:hypothetical protein